MTEQPTTRSDRDCLSVTGLLLTLGFWMALGYLVLGQTGLRCAGSAVLLCYGVGIWRAASAKGPE